MDRVYPEPDLAKQPEIQAGDGCLDTHIHRKRGTLRPSVVEDNGIGIKAEELPRIFEKNFTGTNGRNHERSTGMGLYLCGKLCTKLGIEIHAESEEHVGTKVILEFLVSGYFLSGDS